MREVRTILASLAVAVAFLRVGVAAQTAEDEPYSSPWKTPWSYEQADRWSQLDPEYAACNTGKKQSPIDIRNPAKSELPALQFKYQSGVLKHVINNGHTIRVNYHDGAANQNFLIVGDRRYRLMQFHFHHPSEEYIDGRPYEMEVHLMHRASDGKVAGVTIFLKSGSANSTIRQIWEHMPTSEGQQGVAGVELNPAGLLPHSTSYYTYAGSQTAPPCSEGVTWFVLKTPVEVSAEQINAFVRLYPHDVRPLQPLNGRIIEESQ